MFQKQYAFSTKWKSYIYTNANCFYNGRFISPYSDSGASHLGRAAAFAVGYQEGSPEPISPDMAPEAVLPDGVASRGSANVYVTLP